MGAGDGHIRRRPAYVVLVGGTGTGKSHLAIAIARALTPALDQALNHGTSIGDARPKALIDDGTKKFIAKFSATNDTYSVVKAEFIAMKLADACGLNAAPVSITRAARKDVLLIERFDRTHTNNGWTRQAMVSALTMLGLDEMMARYASYEDLAELIHHRFTDPKRTLRELYGRICFNVLCGNTDDHARNHAAFWDSEMLTPTPTRKAVRGTKPRRPCSSTAEGVQARSPHVLPPRATIT